MKTIELHTFHGGMVSDKRNLSVGTANLVTGFDILTTPNTLIPSPSTTNGDNAATTNRIRDFIYYGGQVWGRGGPDTTTGGINKAVYVQSSLGSSTWNPGFTGNYTSAGRALNGIFVAYHDKFYGIRQGAVVGTGRVWSFDPVNGGFNENEAGGDVGTVTNINSLLANGLVHSKDDVLYLAAGNVIVTYNFGTSTWTKTALTLPSKFYISAMCEYGNYLAIGCTPYDYGKSVVYLWDRDISLTTVSEVIDFGVGNLRVLEQVEGELVGITIRQDLYNTLSTRLVFRKYNGGTPTVFNELLASSTNGIQVVYGQKYNANRLYFQGGIELDGTVYNGVWGVGKNADGVFVVWLDVPVNNDTAIGNQCNAGFFRIGDLVYQAYVDTSPIGNGGWGDGYHMTVTDTSQIYGSTSAVETTVNPGIVGIERSSQKQLHAVALATAPLTGTQNATLKYSVDGGSWNEILTVTDSNATVTEQVFDINGSRFTAGREYRFRLESFGGAQVTGLKYKYEVLETLL